MFAKIITYAAGLALPISLVSTLMLVIVGMDSQTALEFFPAFYVFAVLLLVAMETMRDGLHR